MKPFVSIWIGLCAVAFSQVEDQTDSDPVGPSMMGAWLDQRAFLALDQREAALEQLEREEELLAWQTDRREAFVEAIGGFPERTPLNPKITAKLDFEGYRIEKLYIESQPGFHVTANLYLPAGEGPFPAVLHPTGHSASAKNRDLYQEASIVIAKGGCAVLCYDPVGQGERRQVFKPNGSTFSTTQEHMLINQSSILLGSNTARTMIWDGMRAIDYLQSRPDIIADKIGCTGISGGGTNTSYLMALDDRIVAAAPGCYLAGFRCLLGSVGVQDAEQNIHGQLAFGMDHADYLIMRAPKPTLIMAATEDYFGIEGAREVFRQAKEFATKLGTPDCVEMVEIEAKHGFPPEMQLAAANFFRRELLGIEEPMSMPEVKTLAESELNATPTGKVLDLEGARSVYDLNEEWHRNLPARDFELSKVRELIGVENPEALAKPTKWQKGQVEQQFVIEWGDGIYLPAKLYKRKGSGRQLKFTIYLHEGHDDADVEPYMDQAGAVLSVDLRGTGKTLPNATRPGFDGLLGPDWREATMASLLGQSYVGMQVEDIWQCVRFMREEYRLPKLKPDLVAIGKVGIPALHAAALEPEMFGKVTVGESLDSWESILQTPTGDHQQTNLVFGALHHYDLPDLVASLGDQLSLLRPVRADGAIAPPPVMHQAKGEAGAVATAHPLATRAALNVLKAGGNAVDAAVTAGLTLGVVDGHNSGIGGGCFMLVRTPDGEVFAFDGREMAPAAAHRNMFVNEAGEADANASKTGALASGIPGSLMVYDHVLLEFGMRSLAECLKPGIAIAEGGFPVDDAWIKKAIATRDYLRQFGEAERVFFGQDSKWLRRRVDELITNLQDGIQIYDYDPPLKNDLGRTSGVGSKGDILRQPDLAATYRAIAEEGIAHFYAGPFAEKTEAWMKANGGMITREDFANYRLFVRKPVRSTYRGYEVLGMPPPSSGGLHVAQILNIMETFDVASLNEADRTHLLIEAMKLAFADRAHWLGDSDFASVPKSLSSKAYAAELAQRINLGIATEVPGYSLPPDADEVFEKHTTHFTVADSQGWWVACTATLNTAFGSKVMIPGTGVMLNNQMDDFSIQPGVPNAFGLIGAEANAIEPGKRPLSSMSPTIVLKDGKPVLTVGASGGPTIITQVVQAVHRFVDLGLPLEQCLGQPRVHHQWSPQEVRIEAGYGADVMEALRERGHQLKISGTGTSQAILLNNDGTFEAVADPRREGRADAR